MYSKIQETATWLKNRMTTTPDTAIILGTGLGKLADEITDTICIPYKEIPNFPISTVEGHCGQLIFGKLGAKDIMAMEGRFHYYEGYSMQEVTFPIRVLHAIGVRQLFVSNAAGGVNPSFSSGDLMVITDHINLFPEHPLRGHNWEELGPRFPAMTNAYSPRLIRLAQDCARQFGITLRQGVYVGLQGPSFETPAEYNWLRIIGGDAVGMSTIPEILVARHMGMECFGISVITNSTAKPEHIQTSHAEVQDVGNAAQPRLSALLKEIISQL